MTDISFKKSLVCPWCDAVLNSGRVISSKNAPEGDYQPAPGHLGVCHFCAQIIAFDGDLTLARVTDDDMKAIAGLSAELAGHLTSLQEATRAMDRRNLPQPPKAREETPEERPDCYKCKFRRTLPGNTHSRCGHPTALQIVAHAPAILLLREFTGGPPIAPEVMGVELHKVGIERGWATWPLNYDPIWLRACRGFTAKEKG